MRRVCSRPGCAEPAIASITYDLSALRAWIGGLVADPAHIGHDLCAVHAARFRVPTGWDLLDERHAGPATPSLRAESPMLARAFRSARAS
ncbi:MAG TPA: DUF3499 family protein [Acidimicrobiales bacterium]|nr:DUF3499 family protein [Acidimicrobiales bacterium]